MKPHHLIILSSIMLISSCASHVTKPDHNKSFVKFDQFSPAHWQRFKSIYTPADWPEDLTAEVIHPNPDVEGLPIMLLVHGGGWQRRTYEDMHPIAEYWSKRGFITVNIAYRFAPKYQHPAQLHDVQTAMHWIESQRARWGANNTQVVAFGFSSGAHLVALMANVAGQKSDLNKPHGGIITRPDLVILGGLPSDLQKWEKGRLIEDFLGGTRAEIPEHYKDASPITHINPDTPPSFLFHGRIDRLVPPDHAIDYVDALNKSNIPVSLNLLPLRGHMTSFIFRGNALSEAETFIINHLNINFHKPNRSE